MSTKQRPTVYPQAPAWDRAWRDERRVVADADAFLRDALGEDAAAELALIGGTMRNGRGWAPRQKITHKTPDAPRPIEGPTDGATVTVRDQTFDLMEVLTYLDSLEAAPAFEYVTQSATTEHRDRRAMADAPYVSTFHRPPCDESVTGEPCPRRVKADGTPSAHQCIAEGRTYVSATVPYGEDGSKRTEPYSTATRPLAVSAVRPVTAVHAVRIVHHSPHTGKRYEHVHRVTVRQLRCVVDGVVPGRERSYVRGRNLSPHQGRRARRTSLGYFPDATYAVDPAEMVDRLGCEHWCDPDGTEWIVSAGRYVDLPWMRPALVKPAPPKRSGRPRKSKDGKRSRGGDQRALERLQGERRANVDAVLAAILTACDRARAVPDRTVAAVDGLTVTYSPADGGTLVLLSPHGLHVGSWRGRRAAARSVALAAVAAA